MTRDSGIDFSIKLLVFLQTVGGTAYAIRLILHANDRNFDIASIIFSFIFTVLAILSGFVLFFGASLRNSKLILAHIVVNIVGAVLGTLCFWTILHSKTKLEIGFVLLYMATLVVVCNLEYGICLFYVEVRKEEEEDRTELLPV